MTASTLLSDVCATIDQVKAEGHLPLCVFDLDGTLFDNGPRTWHIVAEYLEAHGMTELRASFEDVPKLLLPYLVKDLVSKIGIEDEAALKPITDFWFKRFFTDEYQKHDEPLAGAVEFVEAVYERGATVVYLTGRDVPGMLVGCTDSLRTCGFPVGLPRTMMVLKPTFEAQDLAFKREAAEFLGACGTVVASFDNEPGNCNLFQEVWPQAVNFFLDTTCAPNPPALMPEVLSVKDFQV